MKTIQTTELSIPSVRYFLDSTGKGWFCDANIEDNGDFHGQDCVKEEEWI